MKQLTLRMITALLGLVVALNGTGPVRTASALPVAQPVSVNAFYLTQVPSDYAALEKLFPDLLESGANTIIVDLWIGGKRIDRETLANLTYLAHQSDLKLFVIMRTRGMTALVGERPDWEDLRYDLGSGTIQPTGRLDFFQEQVVQYLAQVAKDIASYSVDGILLGEDFFYGAQEGMSIAAVEAYREKFQKALVPGKLFKRVQDIGGELAVDEYGQDFMDWTGMKRDRLTHVLQEMMKAALVVNGKVKFGVPIHITGFLSPKESLISHSYDMNAFRKSDVDFYWIAIPHREIRAKEGINYKKGMEQVSRIARMASTMTKDPARTIIAVQTTALSGKILPLTEIEEATAMVKQAGDTGLAFMINPASRPPSVLTIKMFRRQS